MTQKTFVTSIALLATLIFTATDSFAQRRGTKAATKATTEAESPYVAPSSSNKKIEIASNHTIQAGMIAGGVVSGLSIPTAGSVVFGFTGDVAFDLNSDWQISIPVTLYASSATLVVIGAGPQYNFGEGTRMNQFFANLRPGLLVTGGTAGFVLNGTIGKRFEIIPHVAYRPNFGISFNAAAGEASFDLAPIAVSIEL